MYLPNILVRQGYKDGKRYAAHIADLPTGKVLASIKSEGDAEEIISKEFDSSDKAKIEIETVWDELGISKA